MASSIKSAWKAYHSGDPERADNLFRELTAKESKSSFPLTQRGLFLLKQNRYDEAQSSLAQAHEMAPDNPAALFFLALAQELGGERENSRASLELLKNLSPHHQGRSSLELLAELREGNPSNLLSSFGFGPLKAASQPTFGQRLAAGLGRGDPAWLPSDLSSSDYILGPILVEIETRLHALEIPHLERQEPLLAGDIDKLKPRKRNLSEELKNLRQSFKSGNLMKKGKRLLERAWGIADPKEQREPLKRAAILLRAARKADPYTFRVSYHLAEAHILSSKKEAGVPYDRFRLKQAQSSCLASIENEGVNPYILFYLAYVQHLLGRPEIAITYYRAATKKFEKLPEAHYGEGQCHLLLGDRKKAEELLLKAVNSDLALARERLDLYARLLAEKGPEHFRTPLPELPPEPVPQAVPSPEEVSSEDEPTE